MAPPITKDSCKKGYCTCSCCENIPLVPELQHLQAKRDKGIFPRELCGCKSSCARCGRYQRRKKREEKLKKGPQARVENHPIGPQPKRQCTRENASIVPNFLPPHIAELCAGLSPENYHLVREMFQLGMQQGIAGIQVESRFHLPQAYLAWKAGYHIGKSKVANFAFYKSPGRNYWVPDLHAYFTPELSIKPSAEIISLLYTPDLTEIEKSVDFLCSKFSEMSFAPLNHTFAVQKLFSDTRPVFALAVTLDSQEYQILGAGNKIWKDFANHFPGLANPWTMDTRQLYSIFLPSFYPFITHPPICDSMRANCPIGKIRHRKPWISDEALAEKLDDGIESSLLLLFPLLLDKICALQISPEGNIYKSLELVADGRYARTDMILDSTLFFSDSFSTFSSAAGNTTTTISITTRGAITTTITRSVKHYSPDSTDSPNSQFTFIDLLENSPTSPPESPSPTHSAPTSPPISPFPTSFAPTSSTPTSAPTSSVPTSSAPTSSAPTSSAPTLSYPTSPASASSPTPGSTSSPFYTTSPFPAIPPSASSHPTFSSSTFHSSSPFPTSTSSASSSPTFTSTASYYPPSFSTPYLHASPAPIPLPPLSPPELQSIFGEYMGDKTTSSSDSPSCTSPITPAPPFSTPSIFSPYFNSSASSPTTSISSCASPFVSSPSSFSSSTSGPSYATLGQPLSPHTTSTLSSPFYTTPTSTNSYPSSANSTPSYNSPTSSTTTPSTPYPPIYVDLPLLSLPPSITPSPLPSFSPSPSLPPPYTDLTLATANDTQQFDLYEHLFPQETNDFEFPQSPS